MKMDDNQNVTLELYDGPKNASYTAIYPTHCEGAVGAFITFDLTRRESFEHLHNWVNLVKE